jgi:hypothetical protein
MQHNSSLLNSLLLHFEPTIECRFLNHGISIFSDFSGVVHCPNSSSVQHKSKVLPATLGKSLQCKLQLKMPTRALSKIFLLYHSQFFIIVKITATKTLIFDHPPLQIVQKHPKKTQSCPHTQWDHCNPKTTVVLPYT